MTSFGRASIVASTAAIALVVPTWVAGPATASTVSYGAPASAAGTVSAGSPAPASSSTVVQSRKRTRATKVIGWKKARRASNPRRALRTIKVTGPAKRPVKLQKRSSGRWKRVKTIRTNSAKRVNVAFVAERPGSWRLKARAWRAWRVKTTAKLRIEKQAPNEQGSPTPVKTPASKPQGAVKPTPVPPVPVPVPSGSVGARLPVSYSLGSVSGTKLFVSKSGSDSASGSQSAPLRSVGRAISKVSNGGSATIIVRGGTYREGRLTVPSGRAVRLRAFPGEVPTFVGSVGLSSGWVSSGSLVYHAYTPQPVTNASGISFSSGQGLTGDGAGKYPDQVWVGSAQLRQVASKSSVVAGTFWVDRSNKRVYLRSTDKAKGSVEVSSLDVFLTVRGADSVVEGFRVKRFSNSADDYGVLKLTSTADRGVVRDVEISDAAFQAVMLAGAESTSGILDGVVLENVTISRANWMGISSNMIENLTMRRLRISGLNQFKEFTNAPQSGAFKASRNRKVKFVDSVIENNNGHGIWFDQSNYDVEIAGNRVTGNSGSSVFFEISDRLVLANNYIRSTGARAVKLAGASGVSMVNNTIVGGGELGVYVDSRSKPGCADPSKPQCPGGSSSDRDKVRSRPATLDWMPRIDLMINNIVAYPTSKGYCGSTTVCITGSNSTARVALNTVIHKADSSRGIPQTVINGNVYANGSGTVVSTTAGRFSTHSAFGTAMKSAVSISGIESRGKTGNKWVKADGTPTSALRAKNSEAVAVPKNARINRYVPAGTRAYGYLG